MTKAQLRAYKSIRQERDHLARQIEELEAIVYGTRGQNLDGMPRGGSKGNSHIIDMKGDRLDTLRRSYRAKIAELEAQMVEIEQAIEPLEPTERDLIRLHYFHGYTWEQVAVELHYTWRHIHRLHGKILEKLQAMEVTTP